MTGMALTSYAPAFRSVLLGCMRTQHVPSQGVARLRMQQVIKSIGVGPWGGGLSFGDSAVGFLAMWIGHAAAAGHVLWKTCLQDSCAQANCQ